MVERRAPGRWFAAVAGAGGSSSRRGLLRGSAKLAGGGVLSLALTGAGLSRGQRSALAQIQVDVSTPVGVLNYALTLEHLEAAFYRDGLEGFAADDFATGVFDNFGLIRGHEADHVDALTAAVTELGGTPVEAAEYDFGDAFGDPEAFLAAARALENAGVAAYTGAAQYLIGQDALLTAALTIHGVEARHASYLNRLNGVSPFPDAADAPLTPDEVLAIAAPFIAAAPAVGGGEAETAGASGATGGMTIPSTGSGSGHRRPGTGGFERQLGLFGLAGVSAAAAAVLARRASASRDTGGLGPDN